MLFILGTRRRRTQLGIVLLICQRCQRPTAHAILRLRTYFTLFFIPVIPISTTHATVCSLCGTASKLDRAQAEHLAQIAAEQSVQPPVMTPDGPITPLGNAVPSASAMPGHVAIGPAVSAMPGHVAIGPSRQGPPAGWYSDPSGVPGQRWWDGGRWTEHVQAVSGPADPS